MAISEGATKEALAQAYTARGSWVAAHTSASTEASGGGYSRVQTTWSAGTANDGIYTGSEVEITVPAGTYTHGAIYTASTGGTRVDVQPLDAPRTFVGAGGILRITPTYTQS